MRAHERGFTFLELAMAIAIMATLVLLLMPALRGYEVNAQIRQYAALAVAQLRQSALQAQTQGQEMDWVVWFDTQPYAWQFHEGGPAGPTYISQSVQLPQVHASGGCYRGKFMPGGFVVTNCGNHSAQFEWYCFDSNLGNGLMIRILVNTYTSQIMEQETSGTCS